MDIQHKENGKNGSFYIEKEGTTQAEMTYQYLDAKTINIDHTEVKEALQGQGVAHQLIEKAVAFMRENNLKAAPTCSYVQSVFKKEHEKYQDVIK